MSDYSNYDIPKNKYKNLIAAYLRNDGTQLMNKVAFSYDLINNYKDRIVEFWKLFDLNYLEKLYVDWVREESVYDSVTKTMVRPSDKDWMFTKFLENLCMSYQITREYYSPWANDNDNKAAINQGKTPSDPGYFSGGSIILNNLHMLRMLKIRKASAGFDGSRESLEAILKYVFHNPNLETADSEIQYVMRTKTEQSAHATLSVTLIKAVAEDSTFWTQYDEWLVEDGEYFVPLLGIATDFEVIPSDTLVFDLKNWDYPNKYK